MNWKEKVLKVLQWLSIIVLYLIEIFEKAV